MNNQTVLLLIAIGVLIAVLIVVPSSENFGSTQPYTHPALTASENVDCSTPPPSSNLRAVLDWCNQCDTSPQWCDKCSQAYNFCDRCPHPGCGSSVDCTKFPDDPACKSLPPAAEVVHGIQSCAPSDGQWSIPSASGAPGGRSSLNSPCCSPPKYELGKEKEYKTCDDILDPTNPIEACVSNCCANIKNVAKAGSLDPANPSGKQMDASWYPMARCACSLWCYNQNVPHFGKSGTSWDYITGDIAEAQTGDRPDFIGSGGDFAGQ